MDQYHGTELIGKGSYGKVYKAKLKGSEDTYVIKKVAFDGTSQSETESTVREAHVLSLLRHPHVVPYKEFFKHPDGDLCLVMAYCEGGDLFKYIRDLKKVNKSVTEKTAWQWLVQLLLSLSYIHSKRILHRDVKTQNIFLSGGKLLMGDFGLAKQLQRTYEMARTPIGTPYYMAPEIFEEVPYSFKSDVWALGCVMYEMLTGKPAFAADSLSRVVLRVIRGSYDPMPESYSPALRNVISAMLCRDVRTRPSAADLLVHPAVVPYVQSYLESLSAEGPAGWATWRMALPLTALAQMSAALEAAGVSIPGSTTPPRRRSSASGFNMTTTTAAAAASGHMNGANRQAGSPALAQAVEDKLSGSALIEHFDMQSLLRDPASPAAPDTPPAAPATPPSPTTLGFNGEPIQRKPGKLPPLRTPYGLASPFMGNVLGAAIDHDGGKFAELQVITQQMMQIRASQCTLSGAATVLSPAGGQGQGQGQPRKSDQGSDLLAGLGVHGDGGGGEDAENADGGRLDQTLASTMLMTHKALMGEAAAGSEPDALSDLLPQGGFGFGSRDLPAAAAAAAAHAPRVAMTPVKYQQSFEFSDLHALLPPVVGSGPNTPSAAQAHTQPEEGEASASFPDDPAPAPHARAFQQRTAAHSPSPLSRAAGPSVQSVGMAAAAAAKATAALVVPNAHVEEGPEEELLSLQGISLHECLTARAANLRAYCLDALGGEACLSGALAAVRDAQVSSDANGEAALHARLAGMGMPALSAANGADGVMLLPMLEELAFLDGRARAVVL